MNKKSISIYVSIVSIFCVILFYPVPARGMYEESNVIQPKYSTNEVIIKYEAHSDPQMLQTQQMGTSATSTQKTAAITQLQQITQFNEKQGIVSTDTVKPYSKNMYLYKTDGTRSVEQIVASYGANSAVEYAQPNFYYYTMSTPNDTYFDQMWGLKKINMPEAWDVIKGLQSVKVADIDTGIIRNHEDLSANIIEEKDLAGCGNGDSVGHGTHTAGTIGAIGNNSKGVTGVNWNVGIMALRVFCTGKADTRVITQAIEYATAHGADVINMSLGGSGRDAGMANAISQAVSNGITVVVASGNERRQGGSADQTYPASDSNVITVSATGPSDEIAHYSNAGRAVDVAAPGGNASGGSSNCTNAKCILSTWPGSQKYRSIQGTSMATPHVTGLVALMYAIKPGITPNEVKSILESTAVDLGPPGRDNDFGAGRINAEAAVKAITGSGGGGGGGGGGGTNPTPTRSAGGTTPPPGGGITDPTQAPQPTNSGGGGGCQSGDIDCNGVVDKGDYKLWLENFKQNTATLIQFEQWRKAFYSKRA